MADPVRRRRADDDVLRREIVVEQPPPDLADFDVLEAFRNSRAPARVPSTPSEPTTMDAIREGLAAEAAAQTTPAANTRRAQQQVARATAEAERETPISNMAMRQNAADALTLGFADEIYGAGRGAYDAATSDTDVGAAYRRARDQFRSDLATSSARYPRQAAMGAIGGNIAGMALPLPGVLGKLGQGATWGRRAAGAAGIGAIYGGLSGLGHSEVDLTDSDLTAPVVPTDNLPPEVAAEIPTRGMQLARDVGVPLAQGAGLGFGMSAGIDAIRGAHGLYRAARDRAALSRALGDRAQSVIESGRIPNMAADEADDVAMALAAADETAPVAVPRQVSRPADVSLVGEVRDILRENPDVNRIRSAGIVGKPALRRVAVMPGGIEAMADDLDRLGISQRGEVVRTSEAARRAEEISEIARRQRNDVLSAADAAGVRINGQEIADGIRARMEPLRGMPSTRARQQLAQMENAAQKFEGRFNLDGTPNPDWTEITPRPHMLTQAQADEIAQHYGNLGSYGNTGDLPPIEVANARDIRRAVVEARQNALNRWDPERAREFADAQRASQVALTISPARGASELELRAANRSFSPSDMQAMTLGGGIGTAVGMGIPIPGATTAGGFVGSGIGLAGNRMWRNVEPSVMATLSEGPIIQERLRAAGIGRRPSGLPNGLRFMADQLQLRGPRVIGSAMGTPDREEPVAAPTSGGSAVSTDVDAPVDPRAGLPMPGQDASATAPADTDDVDAPIDPFAGLPMPEDTH